MGIKQGNGFSWWLTFLVVQCLTALCPDPLHAQVKPEVDFKGLGVLESDPENSPYVWRPPTHVSTYQRNHLLLPSRSLGRTNLSPLFAAYPSMRNLLNFPGVQPTFANQSNIPSPTTTVKSIPTSSLNPSFHDRVSNSRGLINGSNAYIYNSPSMTHGNASNTYRFAAQDVSPPNHTLTPIFYPSQASLISPKTSGLTNSTYKFPEEHAGGPNNSYRALPNPATGSDSSKPPYSVTAPAGMSNRSAAVTSLTEGNQPIPTSTLPSVPAGTNVSQNPSPVNRSDLSDATARNQQELPKGSGWTRLSSLQIRLASALAPDAIQVHITGVSGNTLRLKIKVPDLQAIDRVAPRVFQFAEQEGYEIKPEFEVISPTMP